MKIIGLSGYARSGKGTAAQILSEIGYKELAFADKVREFLYRLNPIIRPDNEESIYAGTGMRLKMILDQYGWDGCKYTIWDEDIRRHLQVVGTECARGLLGEDVWVNATLNNLDPNKKYVVSDVRFPNEARKIQELGGIVVRIERPSVGPVNEHTSETEMDDWTFNYVVLNNGDISSLRDRIQDIVFLVD